MPKSIEITYNSPAGLPPNFREVDEKEFVLDAMRRIYSPKRMEYRQIRPKGDKHLAGITLYWYQGGKGDAILLDYHERRCRYFLFAECIHENEGVKLGNCWYRYTCKKCGYVEEVDSSG